MNANCDCCTGPEALTPHGPANRPDLTALSYRLGTHASFFDALVARLASSDLPALAGLKTRDRRDPAIALLDAWATVADMLTFYQERIANEGYLRTATERRSVLELARLVGYKLRPGVAASVYLAFTLEPGFNEKAKVPGGTRSQSLPAPGEMPQAFETEQDAEARTEWSQLRPRLHRPQLITLGNASEKQALYIARTDANLKANDPLLLVFGQGTAQQMVRQVQAIAVSSDKQRTQVSLLPLMVALSDAPAERGEILELSPSAALSANVAPSMRLAGPQFSNRALLSGSNLAAATLLPSLEAVKALSRPPSLPPANAQQLTRTASQAFAPTIDISSQLLVNLKPALRPTLYQAWSNTKIQAEPELRTVQSIEKFAVKAAPFGHNAPLKPIYENNQGHPIGYEEWSLAQLITVRLQLLLTAQPQRPELSVSNSPPIQFQTGITLITDGTTQRTDVSLTQPITETVVGNQPVQITRSGFPRNNGRIRFIHLLQSPEAVDVYINSVLRFPGVARFQATPYINLTAEELDDFELIVRPMGQATTEQPLIREIFSSVDVATSHSIYAVEVESPEVEGEITAVLPPDQVRTRVVLPQQDSLEMSANNQVRVRTLSLSRQTGVEIRLGDRPIFASEERLAAIDRYVDLPEPGTYELSVVQSGQNLLAPRPLQLRIDKVYDIVFMDGADEDSQPVLIAFEADAILPGEQFRIAFNFLDLERVYRVILASSTASSNTLNNGFRTFIQVSNGSVITTELLPRNTQRLSLENQTITLEGNLINIQSPLSIQEEFSGAVSQTRRRTLALEAQYDQILPGSWVVINRPDRQITSRVLAAQTVSKAEYGITGKVTQLTLEQAWLDEGDRSLALLRETTIYTQSEPLAIADEVIDPLTHPIGGEDPESGGAFEIELDRLYDGLKPGRWLIVSGERADIPGAEGVRASELVMLAGVRQGVTQVAIPADVDQVRDGEADQSQLINLPGDVPHSFLQLAQPLAYRYKRDTVTLYGNVVKATHGETRREVLGSGDGSQALQQVELSKPPLTYLSAPTREGVESTLEVRVDDVKWQEIENLAAASDTDHSYITRTDNDNKTTVVFGDGVQGARLPSGSENVTAVYRDGIGQVGNVKAEQIKLLATRPLGVKGVINPLPASGGADRETVLQAKRNAPMAVMALDRLVSVQDYADFVRTFAGIAKADAQALSNGRRELIHLTIAGADNSPIETSSDLYRNLWRSLRRFGDPYQPLQIDLRELMIVLISARVRILPQYLWESVKLAIETALFEQFSFERRDLGQDVLLSEVMTTIHQVRGVDYVDVNILDSVSETEAENPETLSQKLLQLAAPSLAADEGEASPAPQPRPRIPVHLAQVGEGDGLPIRPAQLAILSPNLPETLKLEEITL